VKPAVIPEFPPKGPRPILPELDEIEEVPLYKPNPMREYVPDIVLPIPAKPTKAPEPSEPSKPLETDPKPKRKQKKRTSPRKSTPKRFPDAPLYPSRVRRERSQTGDKRIMMDFTFLNAKNTTRICKNFPFSQSNSKFQFKPDPEATRIEPGKATAIGRRKSSIAQVKLTSGRLGSRKITINGQSAPSYLQNNLFLLKRIEAPLYFLKVNDYVSLTINVEGGGLIGQADAIKLGISRALCKYNMDYRYPLRQKGYLTRDARVKERKKYGLKKARKAPQYSKR